MDHPNPLDRLGSYKPGMDPLIRLGHTCSCHVPGCDRGYALPMCNGMFCKNHRRQLKNIRQHIWQAKHANDEAKQIKWRIQEVMCRGSTDAGHWQRICELVDGQPEADKRLYACMLTSMQHMVQQVHRPRRTPFMWSQPTLPRCEDISSELYQEQQAGVAAA